MDQASLRERKKKETREKLICAAIDLAVRQGAANVRVADIAAAANVSPRTFNNYFASKEEAMLDFSLQVGIRIAAAIAAAPADAGIDVVLRDAVMSEFPDVPRKDWLAQLVLMYDDPVLSAEQRRTDRKIEAMAAKSIAQRLGMNEDVDVFPRLAASTMIAAVHVAMEHWLRTSGEENFRETLRRTLERVAVI